MFGELYITDIQIFEKETQLVVCIESHTCTNTVSKEKQTNRDKMVTPAVQRLSMYEDDILPFFLGSLKSIILSSTYICMSVFAGIWYLTTS